MVWKIFLKISISLSSRWSILWRLNALSTLKTTHRLPVLILQNKSGSFVQNHQQMHISKRGPLKLPLVLDYEFGYNKVFQQFKNIHKTQPFIYLHLLSKIIMKNKLLLTKPFAWQNNRLSRILLLTPSQKILWVICYLKNCLPNDDVAYVSSFGSLIFSNNNRNYPQY